MQQFSMCLLPMLVGPALPPALYYYYYLFCVNIKLLRH